MSSRRSNDGGGKQLSAQSAGAAGGGDHGQWVLVGAGRDQFWRPLTPEDIQEMDEVEYERQRELGNE